MSTPTIFDRIRTLEHLTPSETKIAQYLDKAYPLLALETVTSINERARVGRARSFDSFPDWGMAVLPDKESLALTSSQGGGGVIHQE